MKSIALTILGCLLVTPFVWAELPSEDVAALRQQVQQLTESVRQLNGTVQAQQQRIAQLEQSNPQLRQMATPPPATPLPRQNSGGANLSAFNPEIGVVADVVGQLSESSKDGEGNDKLSVREIELVFGHPIDQRMVAGGMDRRNADERRRSRDASYVWDLPTGATVVCAFGASLMLCALLRLFVRRTSPS